MYVHKLQCFSFSTGMMTSAYLVGYKTGKLKRDKTTILGGFSGVSEVSRNQSASDRNTLIEQSITNKAVTVLEYCVEIGKYLYVFINHKCIRI